MADSPIMTMPGFDPKYLPLILSEGKVFDLSSSGTRVYLEEGLARIAFQQYDGRFVALSREGRAYFANLDLPQMI